MIEQALTAGAKAAAVPSGAGGMSPLTALSMRDGLVSIGPLLPEDTGAMFLWLNDVESLSLDMPYRPIDWLGYNSWLESFSKSPLQVVFAIRRTLDPKIIGFTAFTKINSVHRSAKFGIRIGAEADRGKGYGKSATRLMLSYAWNHLNLNRVYLSVFDFNRRAIASYRAAGFEYEGRLREGAFINGNWTDVIPMGVLRPKHG